MQARVEPFEEHADRYDAWFDRHRLAYEAEIQAIDPAGAMCKVARRRGVRVATAAAEALPIRDQSLDFAMMITTICFLHDVPRALEEVRRVLKPGGFLVVGFVDKDSFLGRAYQEHRQESLFYRVAEFLSTDEVFACLRDAGFRRLASTQTIFRPLDEIREVEPVEDGYGEGSFVVIKGEVPRRVSEISPPNR